MYAIWKTSKVACKSESVQSLFSATPGWPLANQSNTKQFSHTVSLENYTPARRGSTVHQRSDFAMQEF